MYKSNLYSYIKNEGSSALAAKANFKSFKFLTKKKKKDEENKTSPHYALYELPLKKTETLKTPNNNYQLISHHLTCFEEKDDRKAHVSEIHYTGYFKDKDGVAYQVHTHFNPKDQPEAVIFSFRANDVEEKITPEFEGSLTQLAMEKSQPIMKELRKLHAERIEGLEKEYNALEEKLNELSKDLAENLESYNTIRKQVIEKIKLLELYSANSHYTDLVRFYINSSPAVAPVKQSRPVRVIENSNNETSQDTSVQVSEEKTVKIAKLSLQDVLQQARSYLSKSISSALIDRQLNISATYEAITSFFALSTDERYAVSTAEFHQAISIYRDISARAKDVFSQLIIKNEIEKAKSLLPLVQPIPEKLIKTAIVLGNAPMLKFLLENSEFPINTFLVKDNLNPVQYCVKFGKLDCLAELIRHDASLTTCNTEEGLPIAYVLVSTLTHPLRKAIIANSDKTLRNKKFVLELIATVDRMMSQPDISQSRRKELTEEIVIYKRYLYEIANTGSSAIEAFYAEKSMASQAQYDVKDAEIIAVLKQDPALMAKVDLFHSEQAKLYKISSSREKREGQRSRHAMMQAIAKVANNFCEVSSEEMLLATHQFLNDYIRIVELKMELHTVQLKLKAFRSSQGKPSKATKQAAQRELELVNEINELTEKYNYVFDEDEINEKISDNMREIRKLLSNFKGIFSSGSDSFNALLKSIRTPIPPATTATVVEIKEKEPLDSANEQTEISPTVSRLYLEHRLFKQAQERMQQAEDKSKAVVVYRPFL